MGPALRLLPVVLRSHNTSPLCTPDGWMDLLFPPQAGTPGMRRQGNPTTDVALTLATRKTEITKGRFTCFKEKGEAFPSDDGGRHR